MKIYKAKIVSHETFAKIHDTDSCMYCERKLHGKTVLLAKTKPSVRQLKIGENKQLKADYEVINQEFICPKEDFVWVKDIGNLKGFIIK